MEALVIYSLVLAGILLFVKVYIYADGEFEMELAPLGYHVRPKKGDIVNLNEYYIDKFGQLYSINGDTWELNRKKQRDILICSNNTCDAYHNIINTLRDVKGIKHTVTRRELDFDQLQLFNGTLFVKAKLRGKRHLTIVTRYFRESKNVI